MSLNEIQRALGNLDGKMDQMLREQERVSKELLAHKGEDRENFQIIGSRFGVLAMEISGMKQDQDRAKGAGWVIIGLLGSVAAFIGSAVIAALSGHIKFH